MLISVTEPQVCQPKQVLAAFQKGQSHLFFSTGYKLISWHRYMAAG